MGPLLPISPSAAAGRLSPHWLRRAGRWACAGLGAALWVLLWPGAPSAAENPFAILTHDIEGRIHQVWPMRVSRCALPARDLLVLHGVGAAPTEEKRLTWMPCGAAVVPGDPRIVSRALPQETAAVDVALLPGRNGPQLVMASVDGLRIEALSSEDAPRVIPVAGGLALPARPWEISRLPMIDDWHDHGPPAALAPALRGAWLIDLESGEARTLPMPVTATYRSWMPHLPQTEWRWLSQQVKWPALARADDDGDGRLDLFALGRFEIFVYHAGPEGLPAQPSRKIPIVPFDEDTEREPLSTATDYFARDIDGDARADLLLSTISGGLSKGRSETRLHLNPGAGVDPARPADARREVEGGFSTVSFVDVDGNGVDEILETSIEFGVLQIVRFLLTRRAETTIRLLGLDPTAPGGLRVLFEDDFTFRIDFAESRVTGLVPNLGDWNGDGALDFYLSAGDDAITFRMGSRKPGEPIFGDEVGRQPVPLESGQSRIADLDGDGLDEIISFSTRDPESPLLVLENLGQLPGTRATLAPAGDAARR